MIYPGVDKNMLNNNILFLMEINIVKIKMQNTVQSLFLEKCFCIAFVG